MYSELSEITPSLKKAFIEKEDRYFYYHPGINPVSIIRAAFNNVISGKVTSGASTITMQVARLLEPKERSYINKFKELFRALQLEIRYSKDEILQLYLNLIPFGGNIEGIKAASLLYLGKEPSVLSLSESVAFSLIPNRPNELIPGRHNAEIIERRNEVLDRIGDRNPLISEEIKAAKDEPFKAYRRDAPKRVPHLAYRMTDSSSPIVRTTIDLKAQLDTEKIVSQYINGLYHKNIKNAACLVVDNETGEVLVYVGSADFRNTEDGGQVDGVQAIRSPGSTLKPLIYGLAFDQGILTPKSIVNDVRVNYSGYEPENYNDNFNGPVSVEFALANSLNIPAVKTLSAVKMKPFIEAVRKAGFHQMVSSSDKLGLSVALGGYGVTLEQMVGLYASFPNQGIYKDLVFQKNSGLRDSAVILSKGSAFMISEILTKLNRPDLPQEWVNAVNLPKIAWKTGTSYGRRDAWSIGYNTKYTVGVWIGNFSAQGVPYLSGAEIATPLLFRIFNALPNQKVKTWFQEPEELSSRFVCKYSGKVPSKNCTEQLMDHYIPDVSNYKVCQHIQEFQISADSSFSYCTTCQPREGYITRLYPVHEPSLIAYYEEFDVDYHKAPPHNPNCERLFYEGHIEILSPIAKSEYLIDRRDSTDLSLVASAAGDVKTLYWYVNEEYYGSSKPNESLFFNPSSGKNQITCIDDLGRKASTSIQVKYIRY